MSSDDSSPEATIGPIADKQEPKSSISLDEESGRPKLQNVDETRLEKQMNIVRAKTSKAPSRDRVSKEGEPKSILKPNLSKRSSLMDNIGSAKELKSSEKSSSESQIDESENPVKVSKSNFKKQQASTQKFRGEEEESPRRRKKYENDDSNTDSAMRSIRNHLQESVVPANKRGTLKRGKKAESSTKNVNLNKARRRRDRHRRKYRGSSEEGESYSSESESSDDSISSNERDKLLQQYFKKMLTPILNESKEAQKKDTMDILKEQGLLEIAAHKNAIINFDKLQKRDPNKDPYLEDEGFAPSDVSGNTTPRKTPSSMSVSISEKKDSFKLPRTSSSQERKTLGTPKRSENIIQLQKQIIRPNEEIEVQKMVKTTTEVSPAPPRSFEPEKRTTSIPIFKKKASSPDKVESAKKTLFGSEPKVAAPLFSQPASGTSLFAKKDTEKKEEEKEEESTEKKTAVKSIFGTPKDTIEELRKSRTSNNSSPSFGQTINTEKEPEKPAEKEEPKKPVSLFNKEPSGGTLFKPTPIKEVPEEENQAAAEDKKPAKEEPKPSEPEKTKTTLFSVTVPAPENPEKKDASKPVETPESKSNPFLMGAGSTAKARNIFNSSESSGGSANNSNEPKKTSLFGSSGPKPSGLFASQGKTGFPVDNDPNKSYFGICKGSSFDKNFNPRSMRPLIRQGSFGRSSFNSPNLGQPGVKPFGQPSTGTSLFGNKPSNTGSSDDVGMSGGTPTQSPLQQPQDSGSIFPFANAASGNKASLFGGQGNSGASMNSGASQGSLFGNKPASSGSTFNMGTSKPTTSGSLFGANKPNSGTLFASGPSQGQPQPASSWSTDPFGGKSKKKNQEEDDGLFSDKA